LERCAWNSFFGRGFVRECANWSAEWTWETHIKCMSTWSRTKWKSMAICLMWEWNIVLAQRFVVSTLSQ
jgi:hypothetical protein